jgi:hypothetical protein
VRFVTVSSGIFLTSEMTATFNAKSASKRLNDVCIPESNDRLNC